MKAHIDHCAGQMLASLNHFIPPPFSYTASGAEARDRGRNLLPDNRGHPPQVMHGVKHVAFFVCVIDGDVEVVSS